MKKQNLSIGDYMKSRKREFMIFTFIILAAGALIWGSLFEFSYRVNAKN